MEAIGNLPGMNTRLLFLPVGYADGIPEGDIRKGNWQPDGFDLLGNVTMDQIMIGPIEDDEADRAHSWQSRGEVEKMGSVCWNYELRDFNEVLVPESERVLN